MRLPKAVTPKPLESLTGFLMRVAEQNRLPTLAVLRAFQGHARHPPRLKDAVAFAHFCGCSVAEVLQLVGFDRRDAAGRHGVMIGNDFVTNRFVSSRFLSVCPCCLAEDPFLRGAWELTLYRACARHRKRLVSACPACDKQLRWFRPTVTRCSCGFRLAMAEPKDAVAEELLMAELIEGRTDPPYAPRTYWLPAATLDRLSHLPLDTLFKTAWFLGHRVAAFERCGAGHAKRKAADHTMLGNFVCMLHEWPGSLEKRIKEMATTALEAGPINLYRRAFAPLSRYLEQELSTDESRFLRLAYENAIRKLWRDLGERQLPIGLSLQEEFIFDE
jgi:hypothetical protein